MKTSKGIKSTSWSRQGQKVANSFKVTLEKLIKFKENFLQSRAPSVKNYNRNLNSSLKSFKKWKDKDKIVASFL